MSGEDQQTMRPRGQGEDATNCAGVSKIRAKNIVFFTGESVTRKEAGDYDAKADFQHLSLLQSREIHHEMAQKNALRGDSCLTDAPRLALLSHSFPPESHYFLANAALRSIASRPAFGRVPSRVRSCLVPRSVVPRPAFADKYRDYNFKKYRMFGGAGENVENAFFFFPSE